MAKFLTMEFSSSSMKRAFIILTMLTLLNSLAAFAQEEGWTETDVPAEEASEEKQVNYNLLAAVVVGSIILLYLIFGERKKKVEKKQADSAFDHLKQVKEYVQELRKNGEQDDTIRKKLSDAGWKDYDIARIMKAQKP
jgi:hypothetical protein